MQGNSRGESGRTPLSSQNGIAAVPDGDSGNRGRWEGLPNDDAPDGDSKVRALRKHRNRRADTLIDGRYRLLRFVASGGMGSVWEAFDVRRDARVALKVMSGATADPESRERFQREITLASGLVGRHFPRVFGYGVDGRSPYLALELIKGETLAARLQREGRLSIDACRWLARELCEALGQAHDFGVIHRDITPKNLMIVDAPDGDQLKVLDLGIARHALFDRKLTRPGMLVGSPRYMSPEQVANHPIDERSDLWSAAVVIYRAVVGQHPFPGDEMQALEAALSKPAIRPSSVVPELGAPVDRFFEIALSKDVAGRFGSAAQLWKMFDAALDGVTASDAATDAPEDRDETISLEDADVVTDPDPDSIPTVRPPASDELGLTNIKTRQLVRRESFASVPVIAVGPLAAPVAKVARRARRKRRVPVALVVAAASALGFVLMTLGVRLLS